MEFYYIEQLCEYSRKGDLRSICHLLDEHKYDFDKERVKEAMVSIYKKWFLLQIHSFTLMASRNCPVRSWKAYLKKLSILVRVLSWRSTRKA